MRPGANTEVRPDLVLKLRRELERGEYIVDARRVAASILARLAQIRHKRPPEAEEAA